MPAPWVFGLGSWLLGLGPSLLGQGDFGIVVEAGAPDALCPSVPQTREAIRGRVGRIDVPEGGSWKALYTIVHSPGADGRDRIRLELRDPSGELKLQRELPVASETCATLAQILALVIERYFRDLSSGTPVSVAPAEEKPPGDLALSAPAAPIPSKEEPSPVSEVAPKKPLGLLVGAFSGFSSVPASAGVGVGAGLLLGGSTRIRASGFIPFNRREQAAGSGWVTLSEYPFRFVFTKSLDFGGFELELGPELLLAGERGGAENLQQSRSGWRVVTGLGLYAAVTYSVNPWFGLQLGLSGDAVGADFARVFSVAGREVLRPDPFRGFLRLGIDFIVAE